MPPSRRVLRERADAQVVPAAALLADPARVAMLWTLVDGRAFTAGELARAAGVGASTGSSHLARLAQAGWITLERHGRQRYVRLVNSDVAALLEALAVVGGAQPAGAPEETRNQLRLARSCYDHLAGRAGVAVTDALVEGGSLLLEGRTYRVTAAGRELLGRLELDTEAVEQAATRTGRYATRACLDWSERRFHLAGALGHALLLRLLELGWFERRRATRALRLTGTGRRGLQREFGVRLF